MVDMEYIVFVCMDMLDSLAFLVFVEKALVVKCFVVCFVDFLKIWNDVYVCDDESVFLNVFLSLNFCVYHDDHDDDVFYLYLFYLVFLNVCCVNDDDDDYFVRFVDHFFLILNDDGGDDVVFDSVVFLFLRD